MEHFEQERLDKLQKLREKGVEPYGKRYDNTQSIQSILDSFIADPGRYKDQGCRAHLNHATSWENGVFRHTRLDGEDTGLYKT
jgi:hypothetical protein